MIYIKKIIFVVTVGILVTFICYNLFPNWTLEVLKLLKTPSTFISFLTTFLSILGAYYIAKNQIDKTLKFSKPQYLQNFNMAQIHIKEFEYVVDKIINVVCTADRINAREKISWGDFHRIEKTIIQTIVTLNPDINERVLRINFPKILLEINKEAPPNFYFPMNGLIFKMVAIHDALLDECKYLDLYGDKSSLKKFISYNRYDKFLTKLVKDFKATYKTQFNGLNFKE